jgi:hypothetical protein
MPQTDMTEAGRKIARAAMADYGDRDPRDTLHAWEREMIVGNARPQIRVPLRDPVELRGHVRMMIGALTELALALDRLPPGDRYALLFGQSAIKNLNQKLNAKRRLS